MSNNNMPLMIRRILCVLAGAVCGVAWYRIRKYIRKKKGGENIESKK